MLQFSGPITAHPSGQPLFFRLPAIFSAPHPLESFQQVPAVLPPFGISGTQDSHPLRSAHPELCLLPSELLQLHLQCKPLLQLRHTWENPLELPNPSLSSLLSATSVFLVNFPWTHTPHPAVFCIYSSFHVSLPNTYIKSVSKLKCLTLPLSLSQSVQHLGWVSVQASRSPWHKTYGTMSFG